MASFGLKFGFLAMGGALMLAACGTAGDDATPGNATSEQVERVQPKTFQQGFEKGFDEKFVETFVSSCVQGAPKTGLPAAKIDALCRCGATDLSNKYSTTELMKLDPEKAAPSIEKCAIELGLSKK